MARDGWHPCSVCGAEYRSQTAAQGCCADVKQNSDDDHDGASAPQPDAGEELLSPVCVDEHGSVVMMDGGSRQLKEPAPSQLNDIPCPDCRQRFLSDEGVSKHVERDHADGRFLNRQVAADGGSAVVGDWPTAEDVTRIGGPVDDSDGDDGRADQA